MYSAGFTIIYLSFIIISLLNLVNLDEIKCKNENGNAVDWFIVYKLPRQKHVPGATVSHLYFDSQNTSWQQSTADVNGTKHAIGFTLKQIYDNYQKENFLYVFYNDEEPNGSVTESRGHTKGVLSFNRDTGFWLVHSLPRFPNYGKEGYDWPPSGNVYAQTFLCITLKYSELEKIGTQLLYNYPNIYEFNIPDTFRSQNPILTLVATKSKHVSSPPWQNIMNLQSEKGQVFYSFAKFTKFGEDLYADWLAPYFKHSLFTETWQNGAGKMKSACTQNYTVSNIEQIKLDDKFQFKSTHDHSKWAVVTDSAQITCLGDINRMNSQKERAGGTVCMLIPDVWKRFYSSIVKIEKCPP